MSEAGTGTGKFIEMRGLVGGAPVRLDTLVAHIVRHDQDEVWLGVFRSVGPKRKN